MLYLAARWRVGWVFFGNEHTLADAMERDHGLLGADVVEGGRWGCRDMLDGFLGTR